jgi:NCS1 family nucleobase:cation symporter-1
MSAPKASGGSDGVPLLLSERRWTGLDLLASSASTSVATWCFIIGGTVSYYLGAVAGSFAMMAGVLIGMLFIILALVPVSTKYGLDSTSASKAFLGTRGWGFSAVLLFVSLAGWNALLLIVLGRAADAILVAAGVVPEGSGAWVATLAMLLGALGVWSIARKGPDAVRDSQKWIAAGVLVLSSVVMVLLVNKVGVSGLLDAKPSAPSPDKAFNVTTGVELLIASAVGWWPYVGGMVRLVPSARRALWPSIAGLGVPVAMVSLIGLYAGLVVPDSGGDPTLFLTQVGGLLFGIIGLSFIILANIGSTVVGVYAMTVSLRNVPAIAKRTSWNTTTILSLLPVVFVMVFLADEFFENFPSFLAMCALIFGPICGVQIVDYFILRRQQLDLADLYGAGPDNRYNFWAGFNPAGFVAIAAGVAAYLALLNPLTYESHAFYSYTTATVPSVLVAGAVYWLASQPVIARGKGGYSRAARDRVRSSASQVG